MERNSFRMAVVVGLCTALAACADAPKREPPSHAILGAREPAISPDGTRLAMCLGSGLWVMPVEGGVAEQVTTGPSSDWYPMWSPDGKSLAFLSDRSGSNQLWIVPAGGGEPRQLTSDPSGKSNPAWSPDGSMIAFTTSGGRYRRLVRSVAVADGSVRDLIDANADYAAWSPDGTRLAFARRSDERNYDIWVVPASGGAPVRVTEADGMEIQPAWSPDGRSIAYASYTYVAGQQAATDLFVVAVEGGTPRRLTDTEESESEPKWTKDGRALVFTSNLSGNMELRTIPANGGSSTPAAITGRAFRGGEGGRLRLTVTEGGQRVPCRISVQGSDGKYYADDRGYFRIAATGVGFFHSDGIAEVDLPPGLAKIRVTRGLEYRIAEQSADIQAGGTREIAVALERWTDMAADGWYSGDNHFHANYTMLDYRQKPEDIVFMAQAEDLNVTLPLVANYGGSPSYDWVEGFWDQVFFEGKPSALSQGRTVFYENEEFRSTVSGHVGLINIKSLVQPLVTGFRGTPHFEDYPPIADIADAAHAQGGVVSSVHPFLETGPSFDHYDAPEFKPEWSFQAAYDALELPVDLALGKVDALDLSTRLDTFERTAIVYRRLLNCGFRLTAGAGTDVYADQKRNPPVGIERVYALGTKPFSYENYIEGFKAGRTFVTNGPMTTLVVDNQPIGATLKLDRPGQVTVKATARAQFPIERMEILLNGVAVETVQPAGDRLSVAFDGPVRIPRSAWLAVRVYGPRQPMLLSNNPLAAHTSPVYVLIGNRPIASATDARFFITWIDKLWDLVDGRKRWTTAAHRQHVRDLFTRAQEVYRRVAKNDAGGRSGTAQ